MTPFMVDVAVLVAVKTFVPLPSLARTEEFVNRSMADPDALALKVTVMIFPAEPVNPGVIITLSYCTFVPSSAGGPKKLLGGKTEPSVEAETNESRADGYDTDIWTEFTACPWVSTRISNDRTSPTECVPDAGEKDSVAARALCALENKANDRNTIMTVDLILMFLFFSCDGAHMRGG